MRVRLTPGPARRARAPPTMGPRGEGDYLCWALYYLTTLHAASSFVGVHMGVSWTGRNRLLRMIGPVDYRYIQALNFAEEVVIVT